MFKKFSIVLSLILLISPLNSCSKSKNEIERPPSEKQVNSNDNTSNESNIDENGSYPNSSENDVNNNDSSSKKKVKVSYEEYYKQKQSLKEENNQENNENNNIYLSDSSTNLDKSLLPSKEERNKKIETVQNDGGKKIVF